jgi:hypothetical protein
VSIDENSTVASTFIVFFFFTCTLDTPACPSRTRRNISECRMDICIVITSDFRAILISLTVVVLVMPVASSTTAHWSPRANPGTRSIHMS